jgi:hypothetical protein
MSDAKCQERCRSIRKPLRANFLSCTRQTCKKCLVMSGEDNAMCNLKPKTQTFSRADGHGVTISPRKSLGFLGSFISCTSREDRRSHNLEEVRGWEPKGWL